MMTKRITVKAFIAAVRKTDTVPRRCLWIKDRQRGDVAVTEVCGIGAMTVAAGRRDYHAFSRDPEGLGLSSEYISGYITGFDGYKARPTWDQDGDELLGYGDGLACAFAAFDEKLHLEYRVVEAQDLTPWMTPDDSDNEPQYTYCGTNG